MRLATRGYDDFRTVAEQRPDQHSDEIDRSLAAAARHPAQIALLWLAFYVVVAFAAWAR